MAGTTFQELLDGVSAYYGSGSDQWVTIAQYGVNSQTIPIIEQVPGVSITRSNSGAFLGFDYYNPFAGTGNPASIIDSNVQTGSYGQGSFNAQLPATAVTNPSTGLTTMQSGAKVTATGSTVAAVADKVSLAVAGVAIGTKLGKLIDSGIYSLNPDWFDDNFPAINPETWDDIASTDVGKSVIRTIFGLKDDSATMYLDERMLAYGYAAYLQSGAWSGGTEYSEGAAPVIGQTFTNDDFTFITGEEFTNAFHLDDSEDTYYPPRYNPNTGFLLGGGTPTANKPGVVLFIYVRDGRDTPYIMQITSSGPYEVMSLSDDTAIISPPVTVATTYFRGYLYGNNGKWNYGTTTASSFQNVTNKFNGNGILVNVQILSPSSGISPNPNAGTQINPSSVINPTTGQPVTPNDNLADILQALKTAYPDLFTDEIYEDVPQEDGTIRRISYVPVPYPNTTNIDQPVTQVTPNVDPQVMPDVTSDTYPDTITQQLTDTLTGEPTPPGTGEGDTPPAIIPTGSANALYAIYNPTQGELNSFGAWLWSSNFVDQLLKLFNDPMQAIIGLHKVFAQPAISGTSTIKVGYLDSQVSSNVVGNQYTTIDCGTVNVSEYFGNVFDYDPFTQIYIYLPFVGIERLDTGDVMRGVIGVKYHVDVLTGACLAEITVTRDGAGGILYTFAGNCAVQYPVSSGSYMGIVASLASIAGGVVGTITSGGALAPVAMGAVSGIMNAHTRVNHSGAFSGNAGAMGVKKPYLIITRPQTCLADNFPDFDGYPANKTTTLLACSGFVKCETCHVENIPATDSELSEIEMLLKGGIII